MLTGYGPTGSTHDFYCFNSSGNVWNGAAFAAWSDGSYTTYRVTATEVGTSGRFTGTTPAGTVTYGLRLRGASLAASPVVWTDFAFYPANMSQWADVTVLQGVNQAGYVQTQPVDATGAALDDGAGHLAANSINAAAIATDAITAAKIATDAITAAKLASDVATEIAAAFSSGGGDATEATSAKILKVVQAGTRK